MQPSQFAAAFSARLPTILAVCAKLPKLYGIAPSPADCWRDDRLPEYFRDASDDSDKCAAAADLMAMLRAPRT
jgi:hypothetical protein